MRNITMHSYPQANSRLVYEEGGLTTVTGVGEGVKTTVVVYLSSYSPSGVESTSETSLISGALCAARRTMSDDETVS